MGKKFKKDDILFCKKFAKEPSVIKVNNEWVKTGGSEFWLVGYDKVSYEEFDNIISNLQYNNKGKIIMQKGNIIKLLS